MLAGTCEDGAVTWAERIREAIHRLEFPFVEQTRSVTASFGVAQRTEVTTDVIDRLSDELRRLRGAVRSSEGAAPLTLISASRMQDLLDLLLDRSQRNNDASIHALVEMLQ